MMPFPLVPPLPLAKVRDPLSNDPFKEGLHQVQSLSNGSSSLTWMLFAPGLGERCQQETSAPQVSWKPFQTPKFLNANYGKSDSSAR